jgi:hypothetical protein
MDLGVEGAEFEPPRGDKRVSASVTFICSGGNVLSVFGFVVLEDALFRLFQNEMDLELLDGKGVTVGSSPLLFLLLLLLLLRFELLLLCAESRDLMEETLFELGDLSNGVVLDRA